MGPLPAAWAPVRNLDIFVKVSYFNHKLLINMNVSFNSNFPLIHSPDWATEKATSISGDNSTGELNGGHISFGIHRLDSGGVSPSLPCLVKSWLLVQWGEWLPERPLSTYRARGHIGIGIFFGTQYHKHLWGREETRFERFPSQKLVRGEILPIPRHGNSLEAENSVRRCFINREVLS